VAVGAGVGCAVGLGAGDGVGDAVGDRVADEVGERVGDGAGMEAGGGPGVSVGFGVGAGAAKKGVVTGAAAGVCVGDIPAAGAGLVVGSYAKVEGSGLDGRSFCLAGVTAIYWPESGILYRENLPNGTISFVTSTHAPVMLGGLIFITSFCGLDLLKNVPRLSGVTISRP
jgi:hypothetical protein